MSEKKYNTGLTEAQLTTAFNRALNDYTDSQIDEFLGAKEDTLTFDSTPTEGSTNPVTSGGVYAEVAGAVGAVANVGAKNKLSGRFTSGSTNGVTFTVNDDGSITATRTATSSSSSTIASERFDLAAGTYIFSAAQNSKVGATYDAFLVNSQTSETIARDNTAIPGNTFTLTETTTVRASVRVSFNQTEIVEVVTFRPMIRDVNIQDDTYTPYAPSNRELYEMILDLQSRVAALE